MGLALATSLAVHPAALAAQAKEPDWDRVTADAAALLADYIRIDTGNPPGNQREAAAFLAERLASEGFHTTIWHPAPGRANLLARWEGTGDGGALVLLSHLDVVPATDEAWSVPPYAGVVKDGAVWGRGAQDMKGVAVAQIAALLALKHQGFRPSRDIIVLATSDEEVDSPYGVADVLEHHADALAGAAFVLTEGGGAPIDRDGNLMYWAVGVVEKAPLWLELEARGRAGHGSIPVPDAATSKLVAALERLRTWNPPIRLVPSVRRYFEAIAPHAPLSVKPYLLDIDGTLANGPATARFAQDPFMNALLRNTVAITVLEGSSATNVLPPRARAELDVRLLPGEDPDAFLEQIRAVVDDPDIRIQPMGAPRAAIASPVDTELFRAIRTAAAAVEPGSTVAPLLLPGFTDCHHFRARGVTCYGLEPFPLPEDVRGGIHGVDERLPIAALRTGVRFMYHVIREVAR